MGPLEIATESWCTMIEKLYTVEEVAELASVTGRTIRNYLKSGRLVGRKIGGQWRFPENEVQRLLTGGVDEEEPENIPGAPPSDYNTLMDPSARGFSGNDATDPFGAFPSPSETPDDIPHHNIDSPSVQPQPATQSAESAPIPETNFFSGHMHTGAITVPEDASSFAGPAFEDEVAAPVSGPADPAAAAGANAQYLQGNSNQPGGEPSTPVTQIIEQQSQYLTGINAPKMPVQPNYPPHQGPMPPVSSPIAPSGYFAQPAASNYPAYYAQPPVAQPALSYSAYYPIDNDGHFMPYPPFYPSYYPPQTYTPMGYPAPYDNAEHRKPISGPAPAEAAHNAAALAATGKPVESTASAAGQPPELSDVGVRVTTFISEVHDCSRGPCVCAIFDMHQTISAARTTSDRLADIAAQESENGQQCQAFVEYDERFYIARYTIFGTSSFLFRCVKLLG